MNVDDLCYTPATELVKLIRAKKLSPVELTDVVLARLAATETVLNAFVTVTADEARAQARAAEKEGMQGDELGSLHGIPMGIKDYIETKGVRTTYGSVLMEHNVPQQDSVVAARVRAS